MSAQPRDPRQDPKAGDRLTANGVDRNVQLISAAGWIRYYNRRRHVWTSVDGWRKWAKNAEVIHAAD